MYKPKPMAKITHRAVYTREKATLNDLLRDLKRMLVE